MTTSRLLLALALLAALAACELGGGETRTGADAACLPAFPVPGACTQNSDCCSYGCVDGLCVANPVEGGACRTTNDCASGRLCKSGRCTTPTAAMCRDTTDVCTSYLQCCSGNCEGASCTTNHAPIASAGPSDVPDVPYTQLYTLQSASTDPDGDPLSHSWTLVSAPPLSAATIATPASPTATFTPDRVGAYQVKLVVTDGPTGAPNRLTSETTVTIHAVNRPPQPTATAAAATCAAAGGTLACSRNNPVRISASVADPDGDRLECAWTVGLPPGAPDPVPVVEFVSCNNPSSTFVDFTPRGEGTYTVQYVVRDHDRATDTVVHEVAAVATFVSRNDPPTIAVSRSPAYYANLGATPATTPAVPLDASASTDVNGDHLVPPGPLTFQWEMMSWPGYPDEQRRPAITGAASATPSFVPGEEGDYVLLLTVTDPAQFGRAGSPATQQVTVSVNRHVQELTHTVASAARASGANEIVLAGRDPSDATKGMLWVYDLATRTEGTGIRLVDPNDGSSALPRLVEVTADGTKAVVVDQSTSIWIVNLGATPTMTRVTQPFQVADLAVATNKHAYLFKTGGDAYMRELDLGTGLYPQAGGYAAFGAAGASGTTSLLYRVDTYFGSWYRYTVNNSGLQTSTISASAPMCGSVRATAIWGTLSGNHVVSSCGSVYNGTTLEYLGSPFGVTPGYVDSVASGSLLVSAGGTLELYGASLEHLGTDQLRWWSQDGSSRTLSSIRSFLDAAGSRRFAVVHDTATPMRYGIVTFP